MRWQEGWGGKGRRLLSEGRETNLLTFVTLEISMLAGPFRSRWRKKSQACVSDGRRAAATVQAT